MSARDLGVLDRFFFGAGVGVGGVCARRYDADAHGGGLARQKRTGFIGLTGVTCRAKIGVDFWPGSVEVEVGLFSVNLRSSSSLG
jgi:hypothetical protein